MIKRMMSLFLVCILLLNLGINVTAADCNTVFNKRIYEDTKILIDQSIQINSANETYINQIIEQLNFIENDEEYNIAIVDAIKAITQQDEKTTIKLNKTLEKDMIQTRGDASDGYYSNLASYNTGISIVKAAGCPNTAYYMQHAIVPWEQVHTTYSPSNIIDTDSDWALFLTTTDDLFYKVTEQFEEKILMTDKSYGTVSGSHEFTRGNSSLDAMAALHNVDYVVTFTKTNVGYSATYKLIDVYDFDWANYENFAVGFGNNYCLMMQRLRYIRPYKITIICHQ